MSVTTNNQDYMSAKLTNSGQRNGMTVASARSQIIQDISSKGLGRARTTYRLRDWSVSRQRYWGSPIPVYYTFAENEKVPFFQNKTDLQVRGDKITESRTNVLIIAKHRSEEKYLTLKRDNHFGITFPTGGIDSGEDIIAAAIREFAEETGYNDICSFQELPYEVHTLFFAPHKDINRYMIQKPVFLQLGSDSKISTKLEPHEKFEILRLNKDELLSSIKYGNQIYILEKYFDNNANPNVPEYTDRYNAYNPHPDKSKWIPHLIPDDELPVVLPLDLPNYKPAGKSPLEDHPSFKYYKPQNHKVPFFVREQFDPNLPVVIRQAARVILIHPDGERYCFMDKNMFPGGEIDNGENLLDAAKREVVEETGYNDFEYIYDSKKTLHQKYIITKYGKTVNRYAIWDFCVAKLNSLNQIDKLEEDKDNLIERLTADEIKNISIDSYKFMQYILHDKRNGEYADRYNAYNPQPVYLRECDTLDTFMCSSFYYLRFLDPHNTDELVSPEQAANMPVDLYIGGKEHTVGHLIYSRFVYKFLRDHGYIASDYPEPFRRLVHQGMVHAHDGRKMSKRRGNVIDPMTIIDQYGSDTLRLYIGFMGPVELNKNRNPDAVAGIKRFVDRVERLYDRISTSDQDISHISSILHTTIKGVTQDLELFKFNTAISKIMVLVNAMYDQDNITKNDYEILLLLLSPFATEITEKLRSNIGYTDSIYTYARPVWNESMIADVSIDLPIQISGKMRGSITISPGTSEAEVLALVQADNKLSKYITSDIRKVIYIQDKICNIII